MGPIGDTLRNRLNDAAWDVFAEANEKAHTFYDDDKIDERVKQCRDILDEQASLPRYIRICTLILLALVAEEEVDFHAAHTEAGMSILSDYCVAH
jgi:hypothetical protein